MRHPLIRVRWNAVLLTIFLAVSGNLLAQSTKKASEDNENLKILGDMPAEDFNQMMHLMSGDLGVDCEYCHLERDRASDELKPKVTARDMLRMTIDLNKSAFKGEQVITCYTCHQGRPVPIGTPIVPLKMFPEPEKETRRMPAAAQVIAKYIEALGGEQKLRAVTSRVVMANQGIPAGPGGTRPVQGTSEKYQKAPNLLLNIYHAPTFTTSNGFDGKRAWAQAANGRVGESQSLEQIRTAREADMLFPLKMREIYSKLTVEGIEKINGHECYVVVGIAKENIPDTYYFDMESGLLIRRATYVPTPIGKSPFQATYDDYRTTNSGVKYPYRTVFEPSTPRLELVTSTTIVATDVKDNVPIDDAKFVRPVSKEPPAAAPAKPGAGKKKKQ